MGDSRGGRRSAAACSSRSDCKRCPRRHGHGRGRGRAANASCGNRLHLSAACLRDGTFAADLRGTLLGAAGLEGADIVAVVNEPSRPQRRGLLSVNGPAVRGDYVRAARTLGRLDVDVVLLQHEYGTFGGLYGEYPLRACSP